MVYRLAGRVAVHLVFHAFQRPDDFGSQHPLSPRRKFRHHGQRPARTELEHHQRHRRRLRFIPAHLRLYLRRRRPDRQRAGQRGRRRRFTHRRTTRLLRHPRLLRMGIRTLGRPLHQRPHRRHGINLYLGNRRPDCRCQNARPVRHPSPRRHQLLDLCRHRPARLPRFLRLPRQRLQPAQIL